MSRIAEAVVDALYQRAAGFCEACGGPMGAGAIHHRHPRGMGGTRIEWIDRLPNLMLVHGDLRTNCHNLTEYSIHANPVRSYRLGHMVRRGQDPAVIPFETVRNLRELVA